jgi:hypothetical protein
MLSFFKNKISSGGGIVHKYPNFLNSDSHSNSTVFEMFQLTDSGYRTISPFFLRRKFQKLQKTKYFVSKRMFFPPKNKNNAR